MKNLKILMEHIASPDMVPDASDQTQDQQQQAMLKEIIESMRSIERLERENAELQDTGKDDHDAEKLLNLINNSTHYDS